MSLIKLKKKLINELKIKKKKIILLDDIVKVNHEHLSDQDNDYRCGLK